MSTGFGNLFGSKSTPVATTKSPFSQLPQFAREAFEQSVSGAQALPSSIFGPAALQGPTLTGIEQLQQAPVDIAGAFGGALQQFQDPFEQQVVQQAIADIERSGAGFLSDIGAGASQAGAFGGQRQGIAEAELGRNLLEQIGRTSGSLRSQGFQTAADRALASIGGQADLQRQQSLDLLQAGGIQQQQLTAEQQAPIQALNFLLGQATGVPTATGGIGQRENVGALMRIGETASSFGGAASGFGV